MIQNYERSQKAAFPGSGGVLGALVREHDWSATPLGPIDDWPQCLRTAVQLALDSLFPTVVAWGSELTCIHNDAYRSLLGTKPEALGRPFLEALPETVQFNGPILKRALAGEASRHQDVSFILQRHGKAEEGWFDCAITPLRDGSGAVAGILYQCIETTTRVADERARLESGRRRHEAERPVGLSADFRALFEATPTPLLVVAPPDWVIVAANDARVRVTGRSREEVIGRKLFDAFPENPDDPSADGVRNLAASLARVLARKATDVMAVQRYAIAGPDGRFEERWWTPVNTPVLGQHGEVALIIHRVEDVTEIVRMRGEAQAADLLAREQQVVIDRLREAEAALQQSENRYRRIVEGAEEFAIVTFDVQGVISGWNSGAERITGWSAAEAVGQRGGLLFTPEDRMSRAPEMEMSRAASDGRAPDERWHLRKDGTRFWGSGLMMPLEDAEGGFLKIFRDRTSEHWADAELRASERRLAALFEQTPTFMAMLRGPEHVIELANPSYRKLVGDRDILGRTIADALPDAVEQGYLELLDSTFRSGEAYVSRNARYAVQSRPNGPVIERHVDFVLQPIKDDAGIVSGIFVEGFEVTDRTAAQAALTESEARYRTLFEAIAVGFCIIEVLFDAQERPTDYVFLEANPAFASQAGFGDVVGKRMRDLVPGHEERWFEVYGRVAMTGEAVRLEEGSVALGRWWDVQAFRVGAPHQRRVAILFNDITERRRAELAIQELNVSLERRVTTALAERGLLAEIVEGTDACVQVVDLDFHWLAVNKAAANEFERIFGVRPKVGDSILELLGDYPELLAPIVAVWRRALEGNVFTEIGEFGDPDRDRRYYEMKFAPLLDPSGRRIGAYQFVYDVTERMHEQARLAAAEEQLRQAQKMEAMGQLTGGVAHDFNNLLTPIVGSLDMLQRRRVGTEREQRLIAGAMQSAERAKTLVQRLLAFARRQPLQTIAVDIRKLIAEMAELVSSTTGPQIKVVVEMPDDLPPAQADANQLEMALLNLSVNARDAMPDGGILRISASTEIVTERAGPPLQPGDYVKLSVADTGTGMDDATLARAVEPFFSTKGIGKGTGLGLSMVHGLASQLGGALVIRSRLGIGTNVELWLPKGGAIPAGPAGGPPVNGSPHTCGTALLVDDEELVRFSTADMLTDLGYEVLEAASAEEAIKLIGKGAAFDLLITDHLMPGMNGTDLARTVRDLRPAMPILLVSGYSELEGIDPELSRLMKPFRKDQLASSLSNLFPAGRR